LEQIVLLPWDGSSPRSRQSVNYVSLLQKIQKIKSDRRTLDTGISLTQGQRLTQQMATIRFLDLPSKGFIKDFLNSLFVSETGDQMGTRGSSPFRALEDARSATTRV
jgi:hypothetical protein